MGDGVDYVPMSKGKIWLIQLLNIAGTGPIFGPILGALYGPVAMLWIVLGCIFAGAVHDYMCGMLSVRNGGASMPYLTGKYLGSIPKHFINLLAVVLLVLVGVGRGVCGKPCTADELYYHGCVWYGSHRQYFSG